MKISVMKQMKYSAAQITSDEKTHEKKSVYWFHGCDEEPESVSENF